MKGKGVEHAGGVLLHCSGLGVSGSKKVQIQSERGRKHQSHVMV